MFNEIQIRSAVPKSWLSRQLKPKRKRTLDDRHYNNVLGSKSVEVVTPSGTPLKFIKGVLPLDMCEYALPALRRAAKFSNHRGYHSGLVGYFKGATTSFTRNRVADWRRC